MAGALETLSGQAYGAQQYYKFGVQIYTGILSLILICTPLPLLWVFRGRPPVLLGQDPEISHEASKFMVCLILALFAYATLQPIAQYFQTQSFVMPMLVMVFKAGLGNRGGALAIGLSCWLNIILLGFYMKYSFFATTSTTYTIPDSIGAAVSMRVSNVLGAGNPRAARIAAGATMLVKLMETANKGKGGDISGKTSG
ncbi:hypothetical protein CDL15_Pgr017612 [Punica granatum]|uniref:Uncharacterized protein n=1 Tax=Punica granatum TaxID=22663 RepID=A0A218W585_PUNGR|nr:hypothetical protein CDL15_Pgr017612 [Punica granatum]